MASPETTQSDQGTATRVNVNLGNRSYDIHIGSSLIENLQDYIPFDLTDTKVFILTDEVINSIHLPTVRQALEKTDVDSVEVLVLPQGEKTKSSETLFQIVNWMLDSGVNRQSILITLGGGVIGDVGGFAASITMRGIPFVQIPTTLLAQVDSSVGGKTGIDMPQGKNLVGSFYQPCAVICDLNVLDTLPDSEMKAGYAEIVKYALINDESFFLWLEGNYQSLFEKDHATLSRAVEISCKKKAEIVAQDEKEGDIRALLNLGHTFAHAFESYTEYDGRVLHGEAVSIGIMCSFRLSLRMGVCSDKELQKIEDHFRAAGLPVKLSEKLDKITASAEDFVKFMEKDKKVYKGNLTFIVTRGIGGAYISRDVPIEDVMAVLDHTIS